MQVWIRESDESKPSQFAVVMRQKMLAKAAAKLAMEGQEYEQPPDISPARFHGMVLLAMGGGPYHNWGE